MTPATGPMAADLDGLEEKLARYLDSDAFENRRRSSRNQHAANLSKTRARKIAKRVLKFKPIAEALARRAVGGGGDDAQAYVEDVIARAVNAFAAGAGVAVRVKPETCRFHAEAILAAIRSPE